MKVAIVGASGLLGEACMRVFSLHQECEGEEKLEVIAVTREAVDLKDLSKVEEFMQGLEYNVCVYAAARSGLEDCRENPVDSMRVNALSPERIAAISHQKGARMIYISTDYVFDGREDARPNEESKVIPISVYGKSKYEGEKRVLKMCEDALICRVSWLFGRGRASFVDQVVDTVRKGEDASYIGDKYSVPNYADDIAVALLQLIIDKRCKFVKGVLHLVNDAEPESWFSYAEQVVQSAIQVGLTTSYSKPILNTYLVDASFFKEARPRHTAMVSNSLEKKLKIKMRHWREGLIEYLHWMKHHDLTNS